jgi:hypothetical protein
MLFTWPDNNLKTLDLRPSTPVQPFAIFFSSVAEFVSKY